MSDDLKVIFIEQRLKSDPVARKILAMDQTATRKLDTRAQPELSDRSASRPILKGAEAGRNVRGH